MNRLLNYIVVLLITTGAFAQTGTVKNGDIAIVVQDSIAITYQDPPAMAAKSPIYIHRAFKPGFKEKYSSAEFAYESKPVPKSWWDRFLEWLGSLFESNSRSSNSIDWVDVSINIAAFLIIGFVVYMIVRAVLNKESMWIFGRSGKKITVQDTEAENIHEMDFKKLIDETSIAGNYRLALRYYYLWLLKKLSVREIIDWHWDKTNTDYLYEIKDGGLRKEFEYLSYVYDHSWYGDFPVDDKAFAKAEKSFKKLLNTL